MAAYGPTTENATGTYRTYAQQVLLFTARYTTTPIAGRPTKVWDGVTYWQKLNTAMAAVPGTSNHGLGLAIDFATNMENYNAFVAWLIVNAATYGYSAEAQSESWHWRYVAGDNVPPAVLAFEGTGPEIPPSTEDDDMNARLVKNPRYQNIWLVGSGPALALSPELYDSYKATVPLVVTDHAQLLDSLLLQSGMSTADLVPV
jgi:hypothetical protein